MTDREKYWRAVVNVLAKDGLLTQDGKKLHWATLECLAESSGFARKNITLPENMARNGVWPKFGAHNF